MSLKCFHHAGACSSSVSTMLVLAPLRGLITHISHCAAACDDRSSPPRVYCKDCTAACADRCLPACARSDPTQSITDYTCTFALLHLLFLAPDAQLTLFVCWTVRGKGRKPFARIAHNDYSAKTAFELVTKNIPRGIGMPAFKGRICVMNVWRNVNPKSNLLNHQLQLRCIIMCDGGTIMHRSRRYERCISFVTRYVNCVCVAADFVYMYYDVTESNSETFQMSPHLPAPRQTRS